MEKIVKWPWPTTEKERRLFPRAHWLLPDLHQGICQNYSQVEFPEEGKTGVMDPSVIEEV